MEDSVRLKDVETAIDPQDLPLTRVQAERAFADVTLELADGTVSFGETIGRSHAETFDTVEELVTELYTHLPRRAVGEPFQSEGDA
ncbi:DUF5789 family protein [Halapricum hydrolyticum]|uniref:Uncharacterized protein n=1 Tax=Halapricum hydrolyticum TaxID=2979991 RepID=A0AAE3LET0_9EURY|nr:hypothetical protein [Halapricum hydrolyticum]MCU4717645.1 hypothetical protein [Halapricum hydrolyticum]MCU4726826.1 hypothetical protein [Halapricum hydrolyticum]